jgi:cold shock CspA family protein
VRGNLIWFNCDKGFGFIRTEDGERLRVEESGLVPGTILPDRRSGLAFAFDRDESDAGEPRAVHARIVTEPVQRRARSRHR